MGRIKERKKENLYIVTLRQEDCKFKASLGGITSSRPFRIL